jgi:hypothetical protein
MKVETTSRIISLPEGGDYRCTGEYVESAYVYFDKCNEPLKAYGMRDGAGR